MDDIRRIINNLPVIRPVKRKDAEDRSQKKRHPARRKQVKDEKRIVDEYV